MSDNEIPDMTPEEEAEEAMWLEQCARRDAIHNKKTDFAHSFGFETGDDWQASRVTAATAIMAAFANNPNYRGSIAQMAEWAHLGADILLGRLNAGVHIQATIVPPNADPQTEPTVA